MKENEFIGPEKFDEKNILVYILPTQKGLVKMRTSVDITSVYDENGQEIDNYLLLNANDMCKK